MKTVNEVSKLTGVSIRTLQYYDNIGLLRPAEYTESGYRLYDDTAVEIFESEKNNREQRRKRREERELKD